MSDNTADETGRPYKVAWWQSKDLHRRFYVAANTYMDHLESRIRELETKLREQSAKDTNDYVQLRAENRKLRGALDSIMERCSTVERLAPCFPLANGIWDMCDAALATQPTSEPEVCEWTLRDGRYYGLCGCDCNPNPITASFRYCFWCGKPIRVTEEDT